MGVKETIDKAIRTIDLNPFEEEVKYFERACKEIARMKDKEAAIDKLREKFSEYVRELRAILNYSDDAKSVVAQYNKAYKELENIRNKYSRMLG